MNSIVKLISIMVVGMGLSYSHSIDRASYRDISIEKLPEVKVTTVYEEIEVIWIPEGEEYDSQ